MSRNGRAIGGTFTGSNPKTYSAPTIGQPEQSEGLRGLLRHESAVRILHFFVRPYSLRVSRPPIPYNSQLGSPGPPSRATRLDPYDVAQNPDRFQDTRVTVTELVSGV